MSTFKEAYQLIQKNRERALSGDFNCIPWGLPRFEQFAPGLEKQKYYIVSANTKVGKTQLTDYMFLYNPYQYIKANPNLDIKLKIIYISMEMTRVEKILQAISRKLFVDSKGKVRLSPTQIKSVGRNNTLSQEVLQKINEYYGYFEEFEDIVDIIDDVRNPYGIYDAIRSIAEQFGTKIYKEIEEKGRVKRIPIGFKPHHENLYFVIVIDNYNILVPEHGETIHKTITKFSADYALKLRNNYGFIPVAIQQQSADQEGLERFKESKLEPSLDGLGDNKLTSRDANGIFGLFSPARHHIPFYRGFDITRMGDHFRTLSIMGGRDGGAGVVVPLYFDGAVNIIKEMPSPLYDDRKQLVNKDALEHWYRIAEANYKV